MLLLLLVAIYYYGVFRFVCFSVRFFLVFVSFLCYGGLLIRIFVCRLMFFFVYFLMFALYVVTIIGCYLLLWGFGSFVRLFQPSLVFCVVFLFSAVRFISLLFCPGSSLIRSFVLFLFYFFLVCFARFVWFV